VEYETITVEMEDKNVQAEINNKNQAIDVIKGKLSKMECLVSEYQSEQNVIQEVGSKFAYLLNAHSNTVGVFLYNALV